MPGDRCSACEQCREVFACPFCGVESCGSCYEQHECEDEGGYEELFGDVDIVRRTGETGGQP